MRLLEITVYDRISMHSLELLFLEALRRITVLDTSASNKQWRVIR
jgi:hypothetical protein